MSDTPTPVTPNDPQASDQPMMQQEYSSPASSPTPNPVSAPSSLQRQQTQAATADVVHHSVFGRAVKSIMHSLNGTETAYRPNPQTGQVEQTTVPGTPGRFFKNLLLGALVGGAAGSEGTTDKEGRVTGGGGFLGGLGRGGTAAMQSRQQQGQDQFKRAQEQLKAQMEREKQTSDEQYHAALTAHENIQTAELLHNQHVADETSVRTHNAAVRAYEDTLIASGAKPAQLSINGTLSDTFDGASFQSAYIKDPSIAKAPEGYQRHFLSTTDLSELHFEGGSWVDDSGNPVNLGKSMSIKVYDSPTSTMRTPVQVSGKTINVARRQKIVDDGKTYSITPEGMSGIYTLGAKEENERARTAATNSRADKANKLNQQTSQIEAKRAAAKAKANLTYWSRVNANPLAGDDEKTGEKGTASKERDEALKAADDAYDVEMGALRGTAAQPNVAPKVFSPSKWRAANPNGDVNAATAAAKQQHMTITN
jgi:hypothetical protein